MTGVNVPVLFYSVLLYISTYGMPLVQSDHLAGTKCCVMLLEIYFHLLHPSCCKCTNLATHDRSHSLQPTPCDVLEVRSYYMTEKQIVKRIRQHVRDTGVPKFTATFVTEGLTNDNAEHKIYIIPRWKQKNVSVYLTPVELIRRGQIGGKTIK